jgi:hypothetical protein
MSWRENEDGRMRRWGGWRGSAASCIRLAADVSSWLRPDALVIPGWPYSLAAALEPGRTSRTLPLDAAAGRCPAGDAGGPPARLPRRGSAVAVVFPRRHQRRGSEPDLAGVSAPLRPRAHVPQAAARLDPPEAPRPGRRRPLDLARHRLLRPALPSPRSRRRHPAALAAALPARPANPRPHPAGVPQHPPGTPRSRQRADIRQAGEPPPPGPKNRRPPTRHDVAKPSSHRHQAQEPQADTIK